MPPCPICRNNTPDDAVSCSVCGCELSTSTEPVSTGQGSGNAPGPSLPVRRMRSLGGAGNGPSPEPARSGDAGFPVVGTVAQIQGPFQIPAPFDGWKIGSLILLLVIFLPISIALAILSFCIGIALWMLGAGHSGGKNRSWLDDIIAFQIIGRLFQRAEPIQLYQLVVETPSGMVGVRQEGELADGRIYSGHRVRLRGRFQRGTFIMRSGSINETLGTELNFRSSRWRVALPILFFLFLFEWTFLLTLPQVNPF